MPVYDVNDDLTINYLLFLVRNLGQELRETFLSFREKRKETRKATQTIQSFCEVLVEFLDPRTRATAMLPEVDELAKAFF